MRPDRLKQLRSAGFDDVANEYLQLVGELESAGRLNLVSVAEYIATTRGIPPSGATIAGIGRVAGARNARATP